MEKKTQAHKVNGTSLAQKFENKLRVDDVNRKGFSESRLIRKRTLRFGHGLGPACRPKTPLNRNIFEESEEPLISVNNYTIQEIETENQPLWTLWKT